MAANGSSICIYGEHNIPLKFNKRHFQWTFTIAQVSQPLLGADFLRAYSLLVDLKGYHLIDPFHFTSITLRSTATAAPHLASITSVDDKFAKLLAAIPDVTTPSFSNPSPKHRVPRSSNHPCFGTSKKCPRRQSSVKLLSME